MNSSDMLAFLEDLQGELADALTETGMRGDAAFLKLSSADRPDRWAVVSSPGDRWFSLEVDGGFSLDYFEEEIDEVEARSLIRRNVALAQEYIRSDVQPIERRWRPAVLTLRLADRGYELRRSLAFELKRVFGMRSARR